MASSTHEVTNQAPPLVDYDVFAADQVLGEAVERHLAPELLDEAREELSGFGRTAGSAQVQEWGRLANENPPKLRAYDRYGNRVDEVEFHPSWHRLLGKGVSAGLTAAWARPGGHVRRAAAFVVWTQVEAGNGCPLSMTHAAVPALRTDPALAAEWEPRLTSTLYDWDMRPAGQKAGALFGMAMTEKQGGSDVRANATVARPLAEDGTYELTGHKWFCSAPMSDGFLVLARAPGGLTCFLVPRMLADGSRNVFRLQRLKEKLGNRSNASAEVEFDGTWARRVGDEGRGVRTIIGMVAATRLDCALGAASLMRQAVAQAVHHCAHREAFGGPLIDKPLMRNVLADLALESEAATVLAMRVAAAYDAAESGDENERSLLRLAVPVAKYWVTKRCAPLVVEASECLGGNGYVEESGMPRLLRESPLNSVWEGAGNVQALDVLRALQREPGALDAYLREVGRARGADHRLDGAIKGLLTELADLDGIEARARRLVERLALVLQGALLVRYAPPAVADAFCASRLGGDRGTAFGTLPHTLDLASIVERARPVG
ncbi:MULTISPECIES: acyl-CoA dehydrogenase family protein [Streptomyces]|uniref:Putative acyl-CoA dehydrogenase n=1 Tax=Streptomyces stelliscabiei TaxID=146820 RepID=A0A8I0PET1_9ACTN|nr:MULTISPECIES: acyl-CoA dehydrogenase family protein [Streptomyces]KND46179.1 acyl-CoA dehydrogenase [Streptomyces stelliscabiei]MBE1601050.1 putative acyl-CoA dehydrogenase [Streptomyces stelliscabiei]MDX2518435.1 acyl-CoA dehydrogenase family protein [Streptomyces stelliscabiei]MDX2551856.1 acyl-CoA dehydrogenase family protein [Streptomyces stelliscabiei]MDX2614530.1 acyl-CoA dehydrogenase family protein [Streptomyces stelliscabiei]